MSLSSVDVVIAGAGPYGLALASHSSRLGFERKVTGKTLEAWRNIPDGMFLKSFGFAATIHTGQTPSTLPDYCRDCGHEGFEPVSIKHFIDYGSSFQQQFVPDVEQGYVAHLERSARGFEVTTDTGEVVARSLARTADRRASRRAAEAAMRPTMGSSSSSISADPISSLR